MPAPMSLTNTVTAETWWPQFNPEQTQLKLEPVFKELEVLGASGTHDQWSHTKSPSVELQFVFDALVQRAWNAERILDAERFISSLCYPSNSDSIAGGDPPLVLFVWPRLYSMIGRVRAPQFTHSRFAATGAPTRTEVKLELRGIISARRLSSEVRERGVR